MQPGDPGLTLPAPFHLCRHCGEWTRVHGRCTNCGAAQDRAALTATTRPEDAVLEVRSVVEPTDVTVTRVIPLPPRVGEILRRWSKSS